MKPRSHNYKWRLLFSGTILLFLLVVGVVLTGRIINRMAVQMSDRIVTQIGEYHFRVLTVELDRSQEVLAASMRFVRERHSPSFAELEVLANTLMQVDGKVGGIWFLREGASEMLEFGRSALVRRCSALGDARLVSVVESQLDVVQSVVCNLEGRATWSLISSVSSVEGVRYHCGIDIPLPELYTYMAEHSPFSRSYATLFDSQGVIVYHPDSLALGHLGRDSLSRAMVRQVSESGKQIISSSFSDYLQLDEDQIYYPTNVAGHRWVTRIAIPRFAIEQQVGDFHFYTILTAIISVLFFAALLILAQRRWRREYGLRRLSERESEQLQLQQVLEQIDPHFLFNSLNSLYALIPRDPELAREFTLTLARVYRHVLERRKQILATLSDEIDFTWHYYSLQKIRFDNRIELTTSIDPALRHWRIPAMSLQTLVENAVKHNRITEQNPLHINIRTEQGVLVIENNFTPRADGNGTSLGVGLERIRSIYRFYTDQTITISADHTTFSCRLPLLPPEK